jgi:hydroxymethylpyrimidine/phosphomethylpyrimidine kinase
MAPFKMTALRWDVARQVRLAARKLELLLTSEWIPEVGTNIAFALPQATVPDEVAALTGRIHRVCSHAEVTGHVNYGASRHVASVVLAAMTFDEEMRSAANIKRTKEHLRRAREAGLQVAFFDRGMEPEGASSTMEWGTLEAIKALGTMPDLIEDAGDMGKEPMIKVLGRDPAEVLDKIRRIMAVD